jgi:ubiquinone/menaquinone biosynthesis C-methylase UbiE
MSEDHSEAKHENVYFLDKQEVTLNNFDISDFVLDIGSGGEGVIGQLKGNQVVAIDPNKRELEEAADGPLKIVMDATDLQFLDGSFEVATSFFTLMYIKTQDQKKVFDEVYRILESNGRFLIWDVDLPQRTETDKEIVALYLKAILPDREINTGYGTKWPKKRKGLSHYKKMAENSGFKVAEQSENGRIFFLELKKS